MIDVVVNGTGPLGRMVFHLLSQDDRYRVRAFTAPPEYSAEGSLLGIPVHAHDDLSAAFSPDDVQCLSILGGLGGWHSRARHFEEMRERGFRHTNYVHPSAVIQGPLEWGTNNVVFPFATVGYGGEMGDDNVLREKVYLGHDFEVGDHAFLGVGVTVGGGSRIGSGAYIAMESTLTNDLVVGDGAFVGIGSLLLRDVEPDSRYYGHPARRATEKATDA